MAIHRAKQHAEGEATSRSEEASEKDGPVVWLEFQLVNTDGSLINMYVSINLARQVSFSSGDHLCRRTVPELHL